MDADAYLSALKDRSAALLDAAQGELGAPVVTCPGGVVADLVAHIGAVWGWAAGVVGTGERAEAPAIRKGAGEAELLAWAQEQSRHLIAALESADPEADCWTFGDPRTRLFWFRRQALETAVHAFDVALAVAEPAPIPSELASDGVDELIMTMLARSVERRGSEWAGQTLHFHCTDGEGEWMVRLGPGTQVVAERAHGKGDVALRGP